MAKDKYIIGLFDHEDKLVHAVRAFKAKKIEVTNVLTPFPVHGLEHELGYEESRLHTAGFLFGMTGMTLALFMMTWVSISNYPLNVGGKPFFALPAFIPITFELTVLFAAVGMVMVYLKRNQLFPGHVPRIYDDRITDDRFAMIFKVDDNTTQQDYDAIAALLKASSVTDIKTKEFDDSSEMFTSIEREFVFQNSSVMAQPVAEEKAVVEEEVVEHKIVEETAVAEQTVVVEKSEDELKDQLFNEIGVASEDSKDDLKKIKGIGKVYEGRLNEIGIFSFGQIAKLQGKGIEAIEVLTGFPGRIQREDWVGQAKTLNEGGTTGFSDKVDNGNVY